MKRLFCLLLALAAVATACAEAVDGPSKPAFDFESRSVMLNSGYNAFPSVGGIVHTHSPHAVGWAQAGLDIPCCGTTHADYFYGAVPCARHLTQAEIDEDYEMNTGKTIVETFHERGLDPVFVPGVLCASHGPFTWGKNADQAVYHAVVLEEVAKMALYTKQACGEAKAAPQRYTDKHFMRKHGPNAYYGQKK